MVHSASGGYSHHKVKDVLVHAEELKSKNALLAEILANHLGSHATKESMVRWLDSQDTYMSESCPCALDCRWLELRRTVLTHEPAAHSAE